MNASDEANKQRFRNIIDKWKNTCIPAASAAYTLMTPQEWLALDTSRPTWEVICERPRSEQCRSKKKDWWDKYQINFNSMQQANLRSGRLRNARRVVDEGKEESAAAPLMMKNKSEVAIGCAQLEGVWQERLEDEPEDKPDQKHNKIF